MTNNFMSKVRKLAAIASMTSLLAVGLVSVSAAPVSASGACAGTTAFANMGTEDAGTVSNPYQIATAEQLQYMALEMNASRLATAGVFFVVTADLDLNGCNFTPGGSAIIAFSGNFDGGNHTISDFVITGQSGLGLFVKSEGALFKDILISEATVTAAEGSYQVAALVGLAVALATVPTRFDNITVQNSVITGANEVGGIAGVINGSGDSLNKLRVLDTDIRLIRTDEGGEFGPVRVGGLFGEVSGYPTLKKSGFFGGEITRVSGTEPAAAVGGLVGLSNGSFTMSEVAFVGEIKLGVAGAEEVGLLVGTADNSPTLSISDSYAAGVVVANTSGLVSGLVGKIIGPLNITNSYVSFSAFDANGTTPRAAHPFSSATTSITRSFYDSIKHTSWTSPPAGTGKAEAELKLLGTFTGWSITNQKATAQSLPATLWYLDADIFSGFPVLVWAFLTGVDSTPCAEGTFSANGKFPCTDASPGRFVDTVSATAETLCPAGTFQPNNGATECLQAQIGFFVGSQGQSSQTECAAGTTTTTTGATSCDPIPCAPGTFSDNGKFPCTDASPGRFVDTSNATAETLCPAGTYQPNNGATGCLQAQIGFFVASAGSTAQVQCAPGTTTSAAGATVCVAIASPPSSGGGAFFTPAPAVTVTAGSVAIGETAVLTGSNMGSVTSVVIASKTVVATCIATSCSFVIPEGVPLGKQSVMLTGSFGSETVPDAVTVLAVPVTAESTEVAVWPKRVSDTQAKLYAKNIVGAGKVSFVLNGREIAWVRAVDEADPKLRVANGFSYLVRTVNLVRGQKNVLEIFVDGERLRRAAYTLR